MPVFLLPDEPIFPPAELAEPDGLLAVGGDLSVPRLVAAYSQGVFPWYDASSPILWWSPDPRPVLFPSALRLSRRMRRTLRSGRFETRADRDFPAVIRACARVRRKGARGTWITPEMIAGYEALFQAGYAHSVEVLRDGELVGGLYGVAVGRAFFGESMFHLVPDASKVALARLAALLADLEFDFIDCQQATGHLMRLGAVETSRREFLARLKAAVARPAVPGPWRPACDDSPF